MTLILDEPLRLERVAPAEHNEKSVALASLGNASTYIPVEQVRQIRADLGDWLQDYRQKLGDNRVDALIAHAVAAREHLMVLASTHDDNCACGACTFLDEPTPWTHWHL
jgi:hypothetical protein